MKNGTIVPDSEKTVVVGAHDVTVGEEHQRRHRVKRFVTHPKYHNVDYDVMLLQLEPRIEYNRDASPICFDSTTFTPGTECVATGWGDMFGPYHIFAACALARSACLIELSFIKCKFNLI